MKSDNASLITQAGEAMIAATTATIAAAKIDNA